MTVENVNSTQATQTATNETDVSEEDIAKSMESALMGAWKIQDGVRKEAEKVRKEEEQKAKAIAEGREPDL